MKVVLQYFSGTGNSYRIIDECRGIFRKKGHDVELTSITDDKEIDTAADLIGFCFPVYAFDIPRICRTYLKKLEKFNRRIKTFVIITAGDPLEAGFSLDEAKKLLSNKNLDVVFTDVVHMPNNWIVSSNPPAKEEAQKIIHEGVKKAGEFVENILNSKVYHHAFNYPPGYSKLGFYKDYYLFKYGGIQYLWRTYRCDDTCNSCGLCEKICPTNSICMKDDKPQWSKSCEQCMRCVNFCPKQAIYQEHEGGVKGKNLYHEPGFKPLGLTK